MNNVALVSILFVLCVVVILSRRRRVQPELLQRLYPGVAHKAEWMASDSVVRRVEADYLAAQQWRIETMLDNDTSYLRGLPRYFSGEALIEQQRISLLQMRRRRPRLIGVLRAHHRVQVRRFSEDGLTCCVIDQQSERRMATYDYWTKRRLHTQDLGTGVFVYQMRRDSSVQRWKIDQLIQQLPLGWEAFPFMNSTIQLTDDLPLATGRDI